jgi:hypothetical protein
VQVVEALLKAGANIESKAASRVGPVGISDPSPAHPLPILDPKKASLLAHLETTVLKDYAVSA